MILNKILRLIILPLALYYIVLQAMSEEALGAGVSALLLVLLSILYKRESKNSLLFTFLLIFTGAHVLNYFSLFIAEVKKDEIDYLYYLINVLYITSYIVLILKIISTLDLRKIVPKFIVTIIVLVILNVFCVYSVAATTEDSLTISQYILEFIYNAVIMTLLSITVINYMYRNDNKSMLLLAASICIVFSEIIQLAYFYVLEENGLELIYSLFLVLAFVFLYLQSRLQFTGPTAVFVEESIEA